MKKIISLTVLVFLNLFFTQFVSAVALEEIVPKDYVTDYTNTLTSDQALEISKTLGEIEKQKGYQIAVVIISKMEDEFGKEDYIEHFATKLYQKLGLGKRGTSVNIQQTDLGMLWLIVKDKREMRMEVGYGLEPILTDGVTKNIQDIYARPYFKAGQYYEGVKSSTESLTTTLLNGEPSSVPVETYSGNNNILNNLFPFIIFFFIFLVNILGWLFAIMARTKSWWLGGVVTFVIGFPILYFGFGLNAAGDLILFIFTMTGFLFDYLISKNYKYWENKLVTEKNPHGPDWWAGGTWGPGSGSWTGRDSGSGWGGFGGGGMSGGGGSNSSW